MGLPLLSAEQIRSIDLASMEMEIPEWGGSIAIKALSVAQRDEIVKASTPDGKFNGQIFTRQVVIQGVQAPKLTDDLVLQCGFKIIDRISEQIQFLSGMKKEAPVITDVTFRQESSSSVSVQPGEGAA